MIKVCPDLSGHTVIQHDTVKASVPEPTLPGLVMRPIAGRLEGKPMTQAAEHFTHSSSSGDSTPAQALARRLAAGGMGVEVFCRRDTCEFTILGVTSGKSLVVLSPSGQAHWYYEPAAGPGSSPAALTAIMAYLLGEPPIAVSPAAYRTLTLKGQVGRTLQDHELNVALRISEDLESFEATTSIDITSPTAPGSAPSPCPTTPLDWCLNWQTAFRGNPATLIDLITPILRPRR